MKAATALARSAARPLAPLAIFAAALVGCGDAPGAAAPEAAALDHFELHTHSGRVISAQITRNAASGPDVSFERYAEREGNFVRGTAFGRAVDLTVETSRAVGIVGTQPFDLRVDAAPEGLHFHGVVDGKPSEFWFGPRAIHGNVGTCGYELRRVGEAYEGESSCRTTSTLTSIDVPPTLTNWSPPELGAALGILLSNTRG